MNAPAPAPSTPPPASAQATGTNTSSWLRLACILLSFLLLPLALVAGIVWGVPEGNDYALATILKHNRLDASSHRIVLVGGSNLAYGIDSALIEKASGREVTNMGMNGYFGVRFMLEEVRPSLQSGDVVVIALEYDSFFKSPDGTASDLLMAIKARPRSLNYLSREQKLETLKAVPHVAQLKFVRVIQEGAHNVYDKLRGEERIDPEREVLGIETLAGFDAHGDLVSHLGTEWKYRRNEGYDLTHLPVDPTVIPLIEAFSIEMRAKGVSTMISFSPVEKTFYETHHLAIQGIYNRLKGSPALVVPSPPSEFVYPTDWFFDTVYHLNVRGRKTRSESVLRDLKRLGLN